jgi:hypothetical protein
VHRSPPAPPQKNRHGLPAESGGGRQERTAGIAQADGGIAGRNNVKHPGAAGVAGGRGGPRSERRPSALDRKRPEQRRRASARRLHIRRRKPPPTRTGSLRNADRISGAGSGVARQKAAIVAAGRPRARRPVAEQRAGVVRSESRRDSEPAGPYKAPDSFVSLRRKRTTIARTFRVGGMPTRAMRSQTKGRDRLQADSVARVAP